ncbi:MAG TPA: hypothetical protein VM165_12065 [Planctomycetaceae bacterium]|nr:hypothetical protein [Planctomycetaceae bacterium]
MYHDDVINWSKGDAVAADLSNIELRGIVYREGEFWFAHCLELDIVAEGSTAQEAISSAVSLCELQIDTAVANNDLESIFRPAPAKFWSMFFSQTRKSKVPKLAPFKPLRKFEARELVLV